MCEYFTNVTEAREFIDKQINHLKDVLEKRGMVLSWKLDKITSETRGRTSCVRIRLDWIDQEIRQLIRTLGSVELETGTETTDTVFTDRSDSPYMTMQGAVRSLSVSDASEGVTCQEANPSDTSGEAEAVTSPVTTSPDNRFFPPDMDLIEDIYILEQKVSMSELAPLEDIYVPKQKVSMSELAPLEDIYVPEKKMPLSKSKSVELLCDPIYEIIDEKSLKNTAGTLGKKRAVKMKVSPAFDLPVVARCPQGKRLGQLDRPKGVAVCPKGRIFVAEKGNNRVQVFDSNANFITSFGKITGSNKMISPYGLFVREDMVYVTLPSQHCIQMYTCQGAFVREKGKQGKEEGRLKSPTGIDGDRTRGKVLVCDTGNNRIQSFDKDLKFIKVIRTTPLDRPLDVKAAKLGDFLVLDRSQTFLHLFNCFGELLRDVIDSRYCLRIINPLFFTLSPQGDIILSDFSNHCVYVFGSDRSILWTLGEEGKGRPFEEPRGLVCDERGRLITVSNKKMDCLQIFEL